MALTYAITTASIGQTQVPVPCPYLSKADIHLVIDGVLVADVDLVWANDALITMPDPAVGGEELRVYRATPADDLLFQAQPGVLDHRQVNNALTQLLYIVQEAFDSALEAREIGAALLTILNTVTNLYNSVVTMHSEVVTDYNFISAMKLFFDLSLTTPYPPATEEKLAEWRIPTAATFDDVSLTAYGGRMFSTIATDLQLGVYKVTYAGEDETAVLLGTFDCTANTSDLIFTRNSEVTGTVDFPEGSVLRVQMESGTNSNINGFSATLRLQRA